MPSDIVGFTLYDRASGSFVYRPGIVNHANLLLGDEIDVQQNTVRAAGGHGGAAGHGGRRYLSFGAALSRDRHPKQRGFRRDADMLPYAQMDRFLVRLSMGYPDHDAQMKIRFVSGRTPILLPN